MINEKFSTKTTTLPSYQHTALDCTTCTGQRIQHGFFTAKGGSSSGPYESLNCGLGSLDDPALVSNNRRQVASCLGFKPERMFGLRQTHSTKCVFIDAASNASTEARLMADALVTGTANQALAILTADCVPVLFAAPSVGLVGAAHAGWRGAVDGVLAATVEMMIDRGASQQDIIAVIGPAIQQRNYEVRDDLRSLVLHKHPDSEGLFITFEKEKHLFNLPGFVKMRLQDAGIHQVYNLNVDTYGESSGLFSHRQATHAALPDCGRQISVIGLLIDTAS